MFGMTNSIPLLQMSGGGLKITDFLEDPVDIFTLTAAEVIDKLNNLGCVLFGSFLTCYNSLTLTYPSVNYIGYIPRRCQNAWLGISFDASTNSNPNYCTFNIYCSVIDEYNTKDIFRNSYLISCDYSNSKVSWYGSRNYGKIWIGKYKQIIQE